LLGDNTGIIADTIVLCVLVIH